MEFSEHFGILGRPSNSLLQMWARIVAWINEAYCCHRAYIFGSKERGENRAPFLRVD